MSKTNDEVSLRKKCLAVLADGPATTAEVCAELGTEARITSATLSNLCADGKLVRRQFKVFGDDWESNNFATVTLWSLRSYPPIPMQRRRYRALPFALKQKQMLAEQHSKKLD